MRKTNKLLTALFFLFALWGTLSAGVDTLGGLPYHPDEPKGKLNLYNFNQSAFAVDAFPYSQINASVRYYNNYAYANSDPENDYQKTNAISLFDMEDKYNGIFYKTRLMKADILLGASGGIEYLDETINAPSGDNPGNSLTREWGKLLVSGKYGNFYLGGLFIMEAFQFERDLPIGMTDKASNTDYFYQVSAGYQVSENLKVALSFDNIYRLDREKTDIAQFDDEMGSSIFVPFQVTDTLISPIYRFHYGAKYNLPFHWNQEDPWNSGVFYYQEETLQDFTNIHLSPAVYLETKKMELFFKLDYFNISYDTYITGSGGSGHLVSGNKTGKFKLLSYYGILAPKPFGSPSSKWFVQFRTGGILYSKLEETIEGIGFDGSTFPFKLNQKISFSRKSATLILGNQTPPFEVWYYFTYMGGSFLYSDYHHSGNIWWHDPIYTPPSYGGIATEADWDVIQQSLSTRYRWKSWLFDLAAGFFTGKYDSGLELTKLTASLGIRYHFSDESWIQGVYIKDFYLDGSVFTTGGSTGSSDFIGAKMFPSTVEIRYHSRF
jgi:hypothetical protein